MTADTPTSSDVARQLEIRNQIELIRLSHELHWGDRKTIAIAKHLGLPIPPRREINE